MINNDVKGKRVCYF